MTLEEALSKIEEMDKYKREVLDRLRASTVCRHGRDTCTSCHACDDMEPPNYALNCVELYLKAVSRGHAPTAEEAQRVLDFVQKVRAYDPATSEEDLSEFENPLKGIPGLYD